MIAGGDYEEPKIDTKSKKLPQAYVEFAVKITLKEEVVLPNFNNDKVVEEYGYEHPVKPEEIVFKEPSQKIIEGVIEGLKNSKSDLPVEKVEVEAQIMGVEVAKFSEDYE